MARLEACIAKLLRETELQRVQQRQQMSDAFASINHSVRSAIGQEVAALRQECYARFDLTHEHINRLSPVGLGTLRAPVSTPVCSPEAAGPPCQTADPGQHAGPSAPSPAAQPANS